MPSASAAQAPTSTRLPARPPVVTTGRHAASVGEGAGRAGEGRTQGSARSGAPSSAAAGAGSRAGRRASGATHAARPASTTATAGALQRDRSAVQERLRAARTLPMTTSSDSSARAGAEDAAGAPRRAVGLEARRRAAERLADRRRHACAEQRHVALGAGAPAGRVDRRVARARRARTTRRRTGRACAQPAAKGSAEDSRRAHAAPHRARASPSVASSRDATESASCSRRS